MTVQRESAPTPAGTDNQIEVKGLYKRFGAGDGVVALENVDLTVRRGEFVAILGPSGCGKSTLLMITAGLTPPSSGSVVVDGKKVTRPLTEVGIVFQRDLLFDWRTVLGNVMLQADIRGLDRNASREKALQLLETVGLRGFADRRPWELSGGMRQRVALCRALLHDASLLLLDEPFGALDAITRDQINLDLQKIWLATGCTAVMVTHSISEAIFLADRVVVMSPRPGRIAQDVTIDLPRPRTVEMRDTPRFAAYQATLRDAIMH
ncbi:MAG: ABC transporter ATP-binding protein [Pseudolabrys sp.]|nr:ABC transporter ATP-binding protein [Pseudolabrys sp.]MCW5684439.1 ABC transporter ATP-binding protein [Pseudolabrys sp.]